MLEALKGNSKHRLRVSVAAVLPDVRRDKRRTKISGSSQFVKSNVTSFQSRIAYDILTQFSP
jgi:hypothetical protein